jgi:Peptidase family M28/PDZ domain
VAAYLNLDMVGRLHGTLVLQGAGSSSLWKGLSEKVAADLALPVSIQEDPYLPTDSTAFYLKGVPTLNAFTGAHDQYHTPLDTPDKINYDGLMTVTKFMEAVLLDVALSDEIPDFKLVPRPPSGTGFRVYLGTVPDMSSTDVKGVLLAGVRVNSPADRAGLKTGDIIVELAGSKIENIYDYSYALTALRVGEQVPIAVLRAGVRIVVPIVPEPRQ